MPIKIEPITYNNALPSESASLRSFYSETIDPPSLFQLSSQGFEVVTRMKGIIVLSLIAIIALTSIPYVLDVYFNSSRDSEARREE